MIVAWEQRSEKRHHLPWFFNGQKQASGLLKALAFFVLCLRQPFCTEAMQRLLTDTVRGAQTRRMSQVLEWGQELRAFHAFLSSLKRSMWHLHDSFPPYLTEQQISLFLKELPWRVSCSECPLWESMIFAWEHYSSKRHHLLWSFNAQKQALGLLKTVLFWRVLDRGHARIVDWYNEWSRIPLRESSGGV